MSTINTAEGTSAPAAAYSKPPQTKDAQLLAEMRCSSFLLPIRFLTHNIRYATTSPFKGEEPWPVRAPRLVSELRFNTHTNPEAFICLQECLHQQLVNVLTGLNTGYTNMTVPETKYPNISHASHDWTYIGVGRDDGRRAGEYSPILYRSSVWQLTDSKTIWLSETPDTPSKGWDAGSIRILTVGRFCHHITKKHILVLNTHLDNAGSTARLKSAELITSFVRKYLAKLGPKNEIPVILTGDFNSETNEEAYKYFTSPQSVLYDARDKVSPEKRYGNNYTYTGFRDPDNDAPPSRIDFVFAGPLDDAVLSPDAVQGYGVLSNLFDDGVFISDHRAVVVDVKI
ncbi:endonuclease/exonuclease/phosphatase family protein [Phyllosticta citricarpa]|uniref:Endonuclease/exonuclease/phosphatase family protein n=2 Tax=Phyllosticta TaxID=121621 RepID=A0ABR1NHT3_9PEZI